ncbi:MAG: hypothetical protein H7210_09130 [Pyrinomonadaceae bacterium]|nr:hypothetical protein [Phycisphaerales bacterium]
MLPSFEEKSVWVQLVSLVLVLGAYFTVSGIMLASGVRVLVPYVPVFMSAVILLVVVLGLGHAVAAVMGKPERRDERDRLIGWRAESNSSWLLAAGVFFAITALVFQVDTVWVAHLLLASMFASEVLKLLLQLRYYRRGV